MPERGRLVVCATPIGNLGDVTLRVLDALRAADVIQAEDTRTTRKLLSRYDIHTPLEAYHARNAAARTAGVVTRIADGAVVALVSDAGTPGISDPGARLVDACISESLPVEVLPGSSAIITALVASGLPTDAFYFGGFPPRKPGQRRRTLEGLAELRATLVFYESPRRVAETLSTIAEVFPRRRVVLARELTKLYEEVLRGTAETLMAELSGREPKGEYVLLVGPPDSSETAEAPDPDRVRSRVAELMEDGLTTSEAVRRVASEMGLPRNVAYELARVRR